MVRIRITVYLKLFFEILMSSIIILHYCSLELFGIIFSPTSAAASRARSTRKYGQKCEVINKY